MRRWAFVDYENLGSLEKVPLDRYERIMVFRGPKNSAIKFGPAQEDSKCILEVIALASSGRNNLDFHLAFYLGRYHETAPEEVEFDVISRDKGFAGLVEHLSGVCRRTKWVTVLSGTTVRKKAGSAEPAPVSLSPGGQRVNQLLSSLGKDKRPKKKPKLVNFIMTHTRNLEPPEKPAKIYQGLVRAGLIAEQPSEKIDYLLPS